MSDQLEGLFEAESEDTPEPEQQEVEVEEARPDEAAESVEETGEKEPEVPPTPEEPKEPQSLPLSAVLDEREKRQEAQRKAEELQRKLDELTAKQQPQKEPDWFDDPATAYRVQERQRTLAQSRFFAEREFGSDLVNEAFAFFDRPENHALSQKFKDHPSPFHAAAEEYKRQKFLAEVEDPDKWREAERERLRAEILAESQKSKPSTPPPSMASKPSTGGQTQPGQQAPTNLEGLFG